MSRTFEDRVSKMNLFQEKWCLDSLMGIEYDVDLDEALLAEKSAVPGYFRPPGPEAIKVLQSFGLKRDDCLVSAVRTIVGPDISYLLTIEGMTCEEEIEAIRLGLDDIGPELADLMHRILIRVLIEANVNSTSPLWDSLVEASPKFAAAHPGII